MIKLNSLTFQSKPNMHRKHPRYMGGNPCACACALVILWKDCSANVSVPWQEDALHHRKVLHENISVWFRAEVSYSITDAQLDGAFECSWCRLTNKLDILELGILFVALSCTFSCFLCNIVYRCSTLWSGAKIPQHWISYSIGKLLSEGILISSIC